MDATVKKIIVSDYHGGFCVDIYYSDGREVETFDFDQEDDHKTLTALFKALGFKKVQYQEVA